MNEVLNKLADDFFQNSLDSSPTSAIMRGYKEYFDKIEELTEEKFNSEKESVESFLSRLCLLYTSPSPRDKRQSRMPSSA